MAQNERSLFLRVTDIGDPSVGIRETSWRVEFPMALDPDNIDADDKSNLDFFRHKILDVYRPFCEGRVTGEWEHESSNNPSDPDFIVCHFCGGIISEEVIKRRSLTSAIPRARICDSCADEKRTIRLK